MKNLNIKPLALVMIGASFLSGCSATKEAKDRYDENNVTTKAGYDKFDLKSAASIANDAQKNTNFSKTSRNWIDPNPLSRVDDKAMLPDIFKKNIAMTMPGTINAVEILSEMQRSTGIKFNLNSDIYDTNSTQGKIVTITNNTPNGNRTVPLLISDFVFRGNLEDALDLLASKANLSWKWNGKEIEIFKYEVKTYNIAALAGSTRTSSNVDLKGDTNGSTASAGNSRTNANSGSSNSSVQRNASLTTWDEVRTFLLAQLSQNGSIAILESSGAVTIKDIPSVHKKVSKSISDLNSLLSKQIFLSVDIYSVSTNKSDQYGVNWNMLWGNIDNKFGIVAPGSGGASTPAGSFNIGVLSGPFTGTNVVLNALSSIGDTSIINQFQVTTLNGQPTPIAANTKQTYLAGVDVTPGNNGSAPTYKLTPGEISSGVNLNITPKIEPSGNILLEYSMNLSEFTGFTSAGPVGNQIQLPSSTLKSILQRANLRSGQTLVLSGFKQANSNSDMAGVGNANNMLLGGNHSAGIKDQYLVITVTPYIANSNSNLK
jgi:type IVB pilus formation R64 PilN family outer membrane protein